MHERIAAGINEGANANDVAVPGAVFGGTLLRSRCFYRQEPFKWRRPEAVHFPIVRRSSAVAS